MFPGNGNIYDYYFDKSTFGTWHLWEKNVLQIQIPPNANVSRHVVFVFRSFRIRIDYGHHRIIP